MKNSIGPTVYYRDGKVPNLFGSGTDTGSFKIDSRFPVSSIPTVYLKKHHKILKTNQCIQNVSK